MSFSVDFNAISDFDRRLQQGPTFVKEPDDWYYVVKNKPSVLECIAKGAVHISFKCAGSWIKQHQHTNNIFKDPITEEETLQTSIYVSREEVEDYFGSDGYWCECYASDRKAENPGANIVKSKRGTVELACKYATRKVLRLRKTMNLSRNLYFTLQHFFVKNYANFSLLNFSGLSLLASFINQSEV